MVDAVGNIALTVEGDVGGFVRSLGGADAALSRTEKQVERLKKSIERYGQTSTELQKQIDGMVGSHARLEKSAQESAAAYQAFDRARLSVDNLRAAIDPLFAASKRYEAAVEQLDAALELGAISASQHADMLNRLGVAYLGAGNGATGMSGRLGFLGNISTQTQSKLQQVGFQVQDFAVQVGAGTSATQAFAQQFPQLASAFGPVGVAIGLLGAVAVPALAFAFGQASGKANELGDAMARLAESTENYRIQADAIRFGVDEAEVVQVRALNALIGERINLEVQMAQTFGRALIPLEAQLKVLNGQIVAQEKALKAYRDARTEAQALKTASDAIKVATDQIAAVMVQIGNTDIASPFYAAQKAAGGLLLTVQQIARNSLVYSGRGGDPRQFGQGAGTSNTFDVENFSAPDGSGGDGGGGGSNPLISELEALQNSFATQAEIQMTAYESQQETLEAALAQKLLTQMEYAALMEQAQQSHQDKMAAIDVYRYGNGLQQAGAFFGEMAAALQGGNEKMQRIGKAFAASEALINAWRAYSQTLADPSLPWFAKIPKALAVLSAGIGAVNAIKGGSRSAGGAAGGSSAAAAAPSPTQTLNFTVTNDPFGFGERIIRQIATQLNEASRNGSNIRANVT